MPPDEAAPSPSRDASVAQLLAAVRDGRRGALDELFPLVYQELRELAHRQRQTWQGDDTLNTTALVHEAYLKLVGHRQAGWSTEAHFLAVAARAIRQILINYARDRQAQKRGGGWRRVPLAEEQIERGADGFGVEWHDQVLVMDEALERLAVLSERQSRIIECRFFGGMTVEQTAEALGLSIASVTRGWGMARTWLCRELAPDVGHQGA
jgi:RNA polymerase sigma factor (TIGR02999 family)